MAIGIAYPFNGTIGKILRIRSYIECILEIKCNSDGSHMPMVHNTYNGDHSDAAVVPDVVKVKGTVCKGIGNYSKDSK